MHFRSDEKFQELAKILEIKNKGELPPAIMTLPQNIFGLFVLKHARASGGLRGVDSDFWDFRGFVPSDKCRLGIFETVIRKIYL